MLQGSCTSIAQSYRCFRGGRFGVQNPGAALLIYRRVLLIYRRVLHTGRLVSKKFSLTSQKAGFRRVSLPCEHIGFVAYDRKCSPYRVTLLVRPAQTPCSRGTLSRGKETQIFVRRRVVAQVSYLETRYAATAASSFRSVGEDDIVQTAGRCFALN